MKKKLESFPKKRVEDLKKRQYVDGKIKMKL